MISYQEMTGHHKIQLLLHMFIQWLAHKDILDTWLTYMVEYEEHRIELGYSYLDFEWFTSLSEDEYPTSFLTNSFAWDRTPEGYEYWNQLGEHWAVQCREIINHLEEHGVPDNAYL